MYQRAKLQCLAIRVVAFTLALTLFYQSSVIAATWDGDGAGNSWATGANWSRGQPPGSNESAFFDNAGSIFLPGEVTNVLDADRTIGSLTYTISNGFHTTDLGGHTLTVNGNLNFNVNKSPLTTTFLRNGTLDVSGAFSNVNVGRAFTGSAAANAHLGGLEKFTAIVDQFHVGTRISGSPFGELTLAQSNFIDAREMVIGEGGTARLHLGNLNTIHAVDLRVAGSGSNASIDIVSGGVLNLGTPESRGSLSIGEGVTNTGSTFTGTVDISNATLHAFIDSLIVGQKDDNPGGQRGTFLGGDKGTISIGAEGNTANMIVGHRATGIVDFGAMQSFEANLDELVIGRRSGTGTVTLPELVSIDARKITVAASGTSSLHLGRINAILADEMLVGGSGANGTLTVRTGGSLTLGAEDRRTSLSIGEAVTNTGSTFAGTFDASGTEFNAYLDSLIVGHKDDNPGGQRGTFLGGDGGTISIGAVGNTANMFVGHRATGVVNLGSMDTFTANLDEMIVGVRGGSGNVTLPESVHIDARKITLGVSGAATLNLGLTNEYRAG